MDLDLGYIRLPVYPWGSEGKISPPVVRPAQFVLLPKGETPFYCRSRLSQMSALREFFLCGCQECCDRHQVRIYWRQILLPWAGNDGRWVYAGGLVAEVLDWLAEDPEKAGA